MLLAEVHFGLGTGLGLVQGGGVGTQGSPLAVDGTGVGKGGGGGAIVCHKGKGLRLAQTSQGAEGKCGKGFGGLVGVWGDGG